MASNGMPQACEVSPPDMGGLTVAAPSGFEPPLSAASLVHDYVEWKEKLCGREWGTIRTYRRHLRMYLDWLDGRTLDGVTRRQVERYVSRPRRGGAPAKPTVRLEVTILRDFYRWAYETGHLPDNPLSLLRAPAQADEQPNPLDDETWCAVWNAPLEDTDRLIFGLGYFGGLRRMEMGSLRGENVDIEGQRLVRFRRKGGGNDTLALGTGMRVVEQRLPQLAPQDASEAFWRALHRSARHPDALVLALPPDGDGPRRASLRGQAVWRRIGRVCEAVDVGRFNPHRLRHSCATNLVRAGVPVEMVRAYMAHRNVQTTLRYVKLGSDPLHDWLGGVMST